MTELEYSEFLKGETDLEREAELISLEHHGIKNQKWGVRRGPPYPIERGGKSSPSGKKKKFGLLTKIKGGKKKAVKKSPPSSKAKEEKKKESNEQIRKKLLTSTDAKYIYEHRDLLTFQELQDRVNRINKENDLKRLTQNKDKKPPLKKVEENMQSLSNIVTSMQKAYTAYSVISKGITRDAAAKKKAQDAQKEKADAQKKEQKDAKQDMLTRNKQKTSFMKDLSNENFRSLGLSQDSVYSILRAYDDLSTRDREAVNIWQQNLLARVQDDRSVRELWKQANSNASTQGGKETESSQREKSGDSESRKRRKSTDSDREKSK